MEAEWACIDSSRCSGGFVGSVGGGIGFGCKQGADGRALVGGELGGKAWGVDRLLALVRRHLAEIEDGTGQDAPTGNGKRGQPLYGIAILLTLLGGETLQSFVAVEHSGALLRIHIVEMGLQVAVALLGLRG